MQQVVLFDIDGTLWNPRKRDELFRAELSRRWGVDQQQYQVWLEEYVASLPDSTHFLPEAWLGLLHGKLYQMGRPVEEKELEAIFFDRAQFLAALYPEVLPVLEQLHDTYRLGVFSQGFAEFQLLKLQLSGLYPWLESDKLFISANKTTAEYLELLPTAVVIDDRPDMIERMCAASQLQPVWLRRAESKKTQAASDFDSDLLAKVPVLTTLEELPELLLQLSTQKQ
jgi:hypothetical protein